MKTVKGWIILIMGIFSIFGLTACGGGSETETSSQTASKIGYEQISQQKAKEIMDTEENYIIIDSRTQEEFDEGHIKGAIMIPEYEIEKRAEKELHDKDALILVYCRSGRRSKIASEALANLGYTNVKEFGGIVDWPFEIVVECK